MTPTQFKDWLKEKVAIHEQWCKAEVSLGSDHETKAKIFGEVLSMFEKVEIETTNFKGGGSGEIAGLTPSRAATKEEAEILSGRVTSVIVNGREYSTNRTYSENDGIL